MRYVLILLIGIILTACGSTTSSPTETVEAYLQAKISADADTVSNLICSELESTVENEVASFSSVEARIDDLACTSNTDDTVVSCDGTIVGTYGIEERSFPLMSYNVVQEDGEWRWCGVAGE
ncbi:MAG: hypothetical protein AAFN11_17985 [Chloroflexota bacterium]